MRIIGMTLAVGITALLGVIPPAAAHSGAIHPLRVTNAVPSYGPKTVVMTTCALPPSTIASRAPASVLTASGPAGGVYGFASCRTKVPGSIYFFLSRAGRSLHELTPYRGVLEAMASDGTGAVYLCYSVRTAVDTSLYIARRSAQGRYSPSALLTHTVGTFRPVVTLAASNGRWWAIWSEATSTEQLPDHVLYERRTLLGVRPRHQITFPGHGNSDWLPALGMSGSRIWLVWTRTLTDSVLLWEMITHANPDGTWAVGSLLEPPPLDLHDVDYQPRIAIADGRTYIVYPPVVFADDGTGHFLRLEGMTVPYKAGLAASAGVVTIATLVPREGPYPGRLGISELRGGSWSSTELPTVDSFDGVVSSNGRATFAMHKQNVPMLYLITET